MSQSSSIISRANQLYWITSVTLVPACLHRMSQPCFICEQFCSFSRIERAWHQPLPRPNPFLRDHRHPCRDAGNTEGVGLGKETCSSVKNSSCQSINQSISQTISPPSYLLQSCSCSTLPFDCNGCCCIGNLQFLFFPQYRQIVAFVVGDPFDHLRGVEGKGRGGGGDF